MKFFGKMFFVFGAITFVGISLFNMMRFFGACADIPVEKIHEAIMYFRVSAIHEMVFGIGLMVWAISNEKKEN